MLLPVLLLLLLLTVLNAVVRRHHLRRLVSKEKLVRAKSGEVRHVRSVCAEHRKSIVRLEHDLASSESTLNLRAHQLAGQMAEQMAARQLEEELQHQVADVTAICGAEAAARLKRSAEARRLSLAHSRPPARLPARAVAGRRGVADGGGGVISWALRRSGLQRFTERVTDRFTDRYTDRYTDQGADCATDSGAEGNPGGAVAAQAPPRLSCVASASALSTSDGACPKQASTIDSIIITGELPGTVDADAPPNEPRATRTCPSPSGSSHRGSHHASHNGRPPTLTTLLRRDTARSGSRHLVEDAAEVRTSLMGTPQLPYDDDEAPAEKNAAFPCISLDLSGVLRPPAPGQQELPPDRHETNSPELGSQEEEPATDSRDASTVGAASI